MASDGVPVSLPASLVQGSQVRKAVTIKPLGGSDLPQVSSPSAASAASAGPGNISSAQPAQPSSVTPQTVLTKTKAATAAQQKASASKTDLAQLLAQLNKFLNTSGRPFEFRVAPDSRNQTIQEVNPMSGEVVAEYAASQFTALAKSLGASGVLLNAKA